MGEKLATGWNRKAEAQALFKGTELLGRDDIKEIVAEADTSDGTGWSLSRPRREEGGGFDAWARAVSGQRELARGAACGAGPAACWASSLRRWKEWAGTKARPSGPQRERSEAGRRGEEKATTEKQAYGPKPRKEKKN